MLFYKGQRILWSIRLWNESANNRGAQDIDGALDSKQKDGAGFGFKPDSSTVFLFDFVEIFMWEIGISYRR